MIFAWACRLGTFLFMRVLKDGQDKRFNEARDNPGKFFVFWSLQVQNTAFHWSMNSNIML